MERKPSSISTIILVLTAAFCLISVICLVAAGGGLSLLRDLAVSGAGSQLRVKVGSAAPDFSLPTMQGGKFSLGEFRGYAVLINFWATWCSPCRAEMPLLQEKYDQHFPHLVILAVEQGDARSDVARVVGDWDLKFTILLDKDYAVSGHYGVTGLPTSFFVDEDGIVRAVYVGQISERELDSRLLLLGLE